MANISGISLDSLRYYDKLSIVSPKRKKNGYRYYEKIESSEVYSANEEKIEDFVQSIYDKVCKKGRLEEK